MPDLVTHLSVAYIVKKTIKIKWLKYSTIFYLGTILPDVLAKVYIIWDKLYWFVMPFHTPFTLILVCLLISFIFEENLRKRVFITLLMGGGLHLFLDFFQKNLIVKFYILFPFSNKEFNGFGLFWMDESVYAIPFLVIVIIIIEIWSRRKRMIFINRSK